jgi:hypothetical protein
MGKKKITNKFASVKRMISTQDHRMYLSSYSVKRTKQKKNSMIKSAANYWPDKHQTMLKLDSCIFNLT